MAYLKSDEIRKMGRDDREKTLKELRQELMHERGLAAMGGSPPSPGKIRQLRRQLARLLTIEREDELRKAGRFRAALPAEGAPKAAAARAAKAPARKQGA